MSRETSQDDLDEVNVPLATADRPSAQAPPPSRTFSSPEFELLRATAADDDSSVIDFLTKARLEGKHIWCLSVPVSVPISVVEKLEIPLQEAQHGDTVFSYDGSNFGVSFEGMTDRKSLSLLLPGKSDSSYQTCTRALDQVVQIRRITRLAPDTLAAPTKFLAKSQDLPAQPGDLTRRDGALGPPKLTPGRQEKGRRNKNNEQAENKTKQDVSLSFKDIEARHTVTDVDGQGKKRKISESTGPVVEKPARKRNKRDKEIADTPVSQLTAPKGKRNHDSSEDDQEAVAAQLLREVAETQTSRLDHSPELGSSSVWIAGTKQAAMPHAANSPPAISSQTAISLPHYTPENARRGRTKPVGAVKSEPLMLTKVTPVPCPVPGSLGWQASPSPRVVMSKQMATDTPNKDKKRLHYDRKDRVRDEAPATGPHAKQDTPLRAPPPVYGA